VPENPRRKGHGPLLMALRRVSVATKGVCHVAERMCLRSQRKGYAGSADTLADIRPMTSFSWAEVAAMGGHQARDRCHLAATGAALSKVSDTGAFRAGNVRYRFHQDAPRFALARPGRAAGALQTPNPPRGTLTGVH
jgi:hypothetical protein